MNHELQYSLRYFFLNMPHSHVLSVQYYSAKDETTINPINNVLKFGRCVSRRLVCNCDIGLRVMTYNDGTMGSWLAGCVCLLLIGQKSSTPLRLSDKASNYQDRFQCR